MGNELSNFHLKFFNVKKKASSSSTISFKAAYLLQNNAILTITPLMSLSLVLIIFIVITLDIIFTRVKQICAAFKQLCLNCRKMVFDKFLMKCVPCLNRITVIRKFLDVLLWLEKSYFIFLGSNKAAKRLKLIGLHNLGRTECSLFHIFCLCYSNNKDTFLLLCRQPTSLHRSIRSNA